MHVYTCEHVCMLDCVLCMHVCLCVQVFVHVCMLECMNKYEFVHTCLCMCVCMYGYVCMHVFLCVCDFVHVNVSMCMYVCAWFCVCIEFLSVSMLVCMAHVWFVSAQLHVLACLHICAPTHVSVYMQMYSQWKHAHRRQAQCVGKWSLEVLRNKQVPSGDMQSEIPEKTPLIPRVRGAHSEHRGSSSVKVMLPNSQRRMNWKHDVKARSQIRPKCAKNPGSEEEAGVWV